MINITAENEKRFEALLDDVMTTGNAAGLIAAAVDKNGNIIRTWNKGWRDAERKLPITPDTIFGIASLTKSFTALSIMQLEEQGKLSLDDPISRYIPQFTNKNQPKTVTIRHLLSHSGGFFPQSRIVINDVAASLGLSQEKDGDFTFNSKLEEEGVRLVAERLDNITDFIGEPGDYMSYFNDGFGILSAIIVRASGEPSFADYVKNHILNPIGMSRSSAEFIAPASDPDSEVIYKIKDGKRVISDNLDNAFVLNGGGAMKSTLSDMAKYVAMYLNEGRTASGRAASMRTVREMVKPRQLMGLNSYYGYGLMITPMDGATVIRHGGSLPGVSSHMAWSYEGEFGVVVLCNTSNVAVSTVADGILRLYMGLDPQDIHGRFMEKKWAPEFLKEVCGRYTSGEGADAVISASEDGRPVLETEGQKYTLTVISDRRAIQTTKFSDTCYEVLCDEKRGVYALRTGTRIVPKVK